MATKRKRTRSSKSTSTKAAKPIVKTAELRLRRMALKDLEPHPRNGEIRKHPEPGSPKWVTLSKSLEHDYFDPIVYNERNGFLVSGHLRLKVMLHDGFTKADVVVVDYDEPTHIARMLAANKGMGDDDVEGQKQFLKEIADSKLSLDLSGFDTSSLKEMKFTLGDGAQRDDDEEGTDESGEVTHDQLAAAVENIGEPTVVAQDGDHWIIGEQHHLFVGSMIKPPFHWKDYLYDGENEDGRTCHFIPCPDITVALTEKPVVLVMVCPSALTASYLLSTYAEVHGEEWLEKQN